MLGEVAATLEPLIPRGWRVFPRGTILSAPTIQLLQAEVNRLGGEYHRSRFRVVVGEVLYTVTINAAGAVTVTLSNFENPHDQPIAGSSVEARPPRGVAEQVRKWGMKYDGQADPLEFLELLEERAITYGIVLDRMSRAVSEIFVERAARWFLTSGLRDVTWAEFKSGFLEFYLPPQYFERLEDQIRSRR
ncbi:hypothetical protein ACLKA6_007786 [Drosophila palustris]